MKFISTRGKGEIISSSEAIIKGIADDGGLYVPIEFPNLYDDLKKKMGLSYEELAYEIIGEFFDDIDNKSLKEAINEAYNKKFFVREEKNFLELYHGPTSAFKDAALLFLPQIMKAAKKKENINEEIVILTATSGDTGKAALNGFSNVDGFKVVVYYPEKGVSQIQQKQMVTQEGNNVKVIWIRGNFDNAQSGVKAIFTAAAGVNIGVITEAKTRVVNGEEVWVIGVDSDQYDDGIYEGNKSVVLTSAIKKIDEAAYQIIEDEINGQFPGGQVLRFDAKNDAVGIPSENPNLSDDTIAKVNEVINAIKADEIEVKTEL